MSMMLSDLVIVCMGVYAGTQMNKPESTWRFMCRLVPVGFLGGLLVGALRYV